MCLQILSIYNKYKKEKCTFDKVHFSLVERALVGKYSLSKKHAVNSGNVAETRKLLFCALLFTFFVI